MNAEELRRLYAEKINQAKSIQAQATDGILSQQQVDQITKLLGDSDQLKAQIDLGRRVSNGDDYLGVPVEPKASTLGYRDAAPSEGDFQVDAKAFRSAEVKTPWGLKTIRYNIPLVVQKAGYAPAFEGYLRKGFADLGPTDRKTLSEGIDTAGGFLVPEDYQTTLIKKIAADAVIRSAARVVTTSQDVVRWPRINYSTDDKYTSGVRLTWTGEIPSSASSHRVTDPVFGAVGIPIHTAMASLPLTNDLIEDGAFDVMGISSELLGEAYALGEDNVFINGDGSGQPLGILAEVDSNGPASVATGSTSDVTAAGYIDLVYAVPAQYRREAKFVMASSTAKNTRKLTDAVTGRYLWDGMNGGLASAAMQESLLGYPVLFDEFVPAIGSGIPVIFGDLRGYMIADRVGFSIQRLSELYAETNITLLLARKRFGGYCIEPYRFRVGKLTA